MRGRDRSAAGGEGGRATVFERDGTTLRFFSTITTFAMPRDITLDELHIECCFPMDEPTAAFCRQLAEGEDDG